MNHRGFRAVVAFAACLAALAGQAKAETATFDDIGVPADEFTLLTLVEYKGLRWSGIEVVNGAHKFFNGFVGCGYRTGIVSGRYVAIVANRFGSDAKIASPPGTTFDFNGVYLTAGWRNGLTVHLAGLRAGARLYSETVVVDTAQPTLFTFGFRGIDTLRISSSGGVDACVCQGGDCRPGPEVVMDDFSFAAKLVAIAPPPQPIEPELVPRPPDVLAEIPRPPSAALPAEPSRKVCPDGPYHGVQVGAFRLLKNATELRDEMSAKYGSTQIHVKEQAGRPIYRVVVGCMDRSRPAKDLREKLRDNGIQGFVVRVSKSAIGDRL